MIRGVPRSSPKAPTPLRKKKTCTNPYTFSRLTAHRPRGREPRQTPSTELRCSECSRGSNRHRLAHFLCCCSRRLRTLHTQPAVHRERCSEHKIKPAAKRCARKLAKRSAEREAWCIFRGMRDDKIFRRFKRAFTNENPHSGLTFEENANRTRHNSFRFHPN